MEDTVTVWVGGTNAGSQPDSMASSGAGDGGGFAGVLYGSNLMIAGGGGGAGQASNGGYGGGNGSGGGGSGGLGGPNSGGGAGSQAVVEVLQVVAAEILVIKFWKIFQFFWI